MSVCLLCDAEVDYSCSFSVCDDPEHLANVWGGDTHEYVGYLCDECGEMFQKKAEKLSNGGMY